MKRLFVLLALFCLVPAAAQAQLPQPAAEASTPRTLSLQGEVIAFDFTSPVTRIVLDVRNSDGSASAWTAETRSAVELRRFGWTSNSLTPGEVILVRGQVLDASTGRLQLQEVERVNGTRLVPGDSRALSQISGGTYQLVPGRSFVRLSFDHQGFSTASFWFTRMLASVTLDSDAQPVSLQVDLLTEDLESGSAELTRLLKSGAFFAASSYPVISYASRKIQALGENRYRVDGELNIKGIGYPLELRTVVNRAGAHPLTGNPGFGISARGSLDRANWSLDQFGPAVGLEVQIEVDAEFELGVGSNSGR